MYCHEIYDQFIFTFVRLRPYQRMFLNNLCDHVYSVSCTSQQKLMKESVLQIMKSIEYEKTTVS